MNRIIKFRAWDKSQKIMRQDVSIAAVEDCVFMQFTGLFDKKGKEVYEGDVVNYNNNLFQVNWNFLHLCWGLYTCGDSFYSSITADTYAPNNTIPTRTSRLQVVGNLFENPELKK